MRFFLILTALCLFQTSAAKAEDNALALPPTGHVLINLSATETRSLAQDQLMASLRIEKDDKTPEAVQNAVNTAMTAALELAKKETTVKVSTGGYYVYKNDEPIIDPKTGNHNGKFKSTWRASQTIDLVSKDAAKMLDLTGKIQGAGFVMNNLTYMLSPERAEAVRDEMMVLALKKLQAKAKIAADALGKSGYDLTDVNLDMGGAAPSPMYAVRSMAKMEMAADMAAPVADAGETSVSLTVSARALLKP